AEVHPVRAEPRRPGAARHLLLLLGHAVQFKGGADRRGKEDPAVRRAARLPEAGAGLSGAERGVGQEDAGCVDGDDPGAMSAAGQKRIAWASVSPALLWTLVFFAVPFAAMSLQSLFPEGGDGLSLANYIQFFTQPSY